MKINIDEMIKKNKIIQKIDSYEDDIELYKTKIYEMCELKRNAISRAKNGGLLVYSDVDLYHKRKNIRYEYKISRMLLNKIDKEMYKLSEKIDKTKMKIEKLEKKVEEI